MNLESSDDVVILGGGAAGLMCAATAGQRGRRVRVLERAERLGKKILVSGGGRCNFTNLHAGPENYLCGQPQFPRSALARYRPEDFVALVERHGVAYHEKKLGQLFCDGSSREIVELLAAECADAGVHVETGADVRRVERAADGAFCVTVGSRELRAHALVVACGGLSWPKLGGTDLAHRLARQFGLRIVAPRPGLVPLTFDGPTGALCESLSGVSIPVVARASARTPPSGHGEYDEYVPIPEKHRETPAAPAYPRAGFGPAFRENLLFTHRGLSGPAVLQASSYLPTERGALRVNLLPDEPDPLWLLRQSQRDAHLHNVLADKLPARLADGVCELLEMWRPMREVPRRDLKFVGHWLQDFRFNPSGTEGYPKAEVTLGGVDTRDLQSKTMEARAVPGLYFIGEAVDVTGHLGGFNFQWAWASGHATGEAA